MREADGELVGNAKVRVITGETSPAHIDRVDACGAGPPVRPADELFDLVFIALGEKLHGSVRSIFDPSREPEAPRLTLRRRAKEHTLHPATNEELYLLQRHFGFFLAKLRSEGNFGRNSRGLTAIIWASGSLANEAYRRGRCFGDPRAEGRRAEG